VREFSQASQTGLAGLVFIVFLPVMAACALAVALDIGFPFLYRQKRVGRGERVFTLYKFRTMKAATDMHGNPLPDKDRLTEVGRVLRALSLDELPQLWNVLKGDMSLVGPRPLLPEYLRRYTPFQARRHEVKSGITGWAQVNGRNGLSWERKFELDVWYVDHQSFWLDLRILWLTLLKVLRREGISQSDHATMPKFLGTQTDAAAANRQN
jgi:sugar transferase EpsL